MELLVVIFIIVLIGNIYISYKKIKLEELKLFESIDFNSKYELLDNIIMEEVDNYKVLNFVYREDDLYINEEMQKEMINTVTVKTIERITGAIRSNLKLVYNIKSDEDLINIVGRLVSLQVLSYCIDINGVRDE